ncbi:hypothetical protein EIP91_008106, partial [Steccherinum ochraceum]
IVLPLVGALKQVFDGPGSIAAQFLDDFPSTEHGPEKTIVRYIPHAMIAMVATGIFIALSELALLPTSKKTKKKARGDGAQFKSSFWQAQYAHIVSVSKRIEERNPEAWDHMSSKLFMTAYEDDGATGGAGNNDDNYLDIADMST